jgi:hypothetical protein
MRYRHPFPPDRRNDIRLRWAEYRCLYCRRSINDRLLIPAHEAICDARFIVERQWQQKIERARTREAHDREAV